MNIRWTYWLAACLALVSWTVVVYASDPPGTRTYSVDVPTSNLPSPFKANPAPGPLSIRVRGTRGHLDAFQASSLHVSAAFDQVHDVGQQTVAVTVTNSDPSVELDSPPTSVSVAIDRFDHRQIPVGVRFTAGAPDGYSYKAGDVTVAPAVVTVFGPSKRLQDLHAEALVSLTNIKTTYESNPKVFIYQGADPANRISDLTVQPSTVVVDVPVTSNTVSRASAVVPTTTGSVGFGRVVSGISVSPPSVVLNGPQDVLAGLDSVTTDPIKLTGLFTTVKETVNVVAQGQGVTVTPAKVTVTITISFLPSSPTPSPSPTSTPAPGSPSPSATP